MGILRATEIVNDSTFKLFAIEAIERHHVQTHNACHAFGKIEPIAVIVCGPMGVYASDMQAQPVDIEALRQAVPGLDRLLETLETA